MRLTLRALLGSMHGLLLPEDQAKLQEKIEASQFAQQILRHIQDRIARKELSPLPLEGIGLSRDPNVVAEYLDHELSPEEVPKFEQLCFQSDRHLAEVASCHQILSLLYGERIEISSRLRDEIYQIDSSSNRISLDYDQILKQLNKRTESSQDDSTDPVKDKDEGQEVDLRAEPRAQEVHQTAIHSSESAPNNDDEPKQKNLDSTLLLNHESKELQQSVELIRDQPISGKRSKSKHSGIWLITAALILIAATVASLWHYQSTFVELVNTQLPGYSKKEITTDDKPEKIPTSEIARTSFETPDQTKSTVTSSFGLHSKSGLVFHENQQGGLSLLNSQFDLIGERSIFVAPDSRAVLSLPTPKYFVAVDGSRFSLDKEKIHSLNYGKFILNLSPNSELAFQILDQTQIQIASKNKTTNLAIEICRRKTRGIDPLKTPPQSQLAIYALSGEADLTFMQRKKIHLSSKMNGLWQLENHQLAHLEMNKNRDNPSWIKATLDDQTKQPVLRDLELRLAASNNISETLLALAQTGRPDLKDAAVRIFANQGFYQPLLASFSDPSQHAFWQDQWDMITAEKNTCASSSQDLFDQIKLIYPENAEQIFRSTWGYTKQQIEMGESVRLIENLSHPDLVVRVTAFLNLRELTGLTLGFEPHGSAAENTLAIRQWWERWRKGEIKFAPSP